MNRTFVAKYLAKEVGVKIIRCDHTWGGTYGYELPDGYRCLGYNKEEHALIEWANDHIGKDVLKAIVKMVKYERSLCSCSKEAAQKRRRKQGAEANG